MKKKKRVFKENLESETSTKSFEKRGHNIVHITDKEDYFRLLNDQKKAARKCIDCEYNKEGFCKKYKRFATNARTECIVR